MAHLRNVTLFISHGACCPSSAESWDDVQYFIEVLQNLAPHLNTIRIAFRYKPWSPNSLSHPYSPYPAFTAVGFLHALSLVFAGLPLVYRAEGYRVENRGANGFMRDGKIAFGGENGVVSFIRSCVATDVRFASK
jgi:hypothetical protein